VAGRAEPDDDHARGVGEHVEGGGELLVAEPFGQAGEGTGAGGDVAGDHPVAEGADGRLQSAGLGQFRGEVFPEFVEAGEAELVDRPDDGRVAGPGCGGEFQCGQVADTVRVGQQEVRDAGLGG
jgi:hypothetical protein